eukprot:TRINITY_DN7169_c0_g1_i1.p1 TRINITY_DN7169_c0_g1~~TRINITY_DN7169_c0_g1_i1.p1  ORF type:complete len:545 (+),score=182.69 TRINITY_DN7169_c0_g1_i1:58-1692(+)
MEDASTFALCYLKSIGAHKSAHELEKFNRSHFDVKYFEELAREGKWKILYRYVNAFLSWKNGENHQILVEILRNRFMEPLMRGNIQKARRIFCMEIGNIPCDKQLKMRILGSFLKILNIEKREEIQWEGEEMEREGFLQLSKKKIISLLGLIANPLQNEFISKKRKMEDENPRHEELNKNNQKFTQNLVFDEDSFDLVNSYHTIEEEIKYPKNEDRDGEWDGDSLDDFVFLSNISSNNATNSINQQFKEIRNTENSEEESDSESESSLSDSNSKDNERLSSSSSSSSSDEDSIDGSQDLDESFSRISKKREKPKGKRTRPTKETMHNLENIIIPIIERVASSANTAKKASMLWEYVKNDWMRLKGINLSESKEKSNFSAWLTNNKAKYNIKFTNDGLFIESRRSVDDEDEEDKGEDYFDKKGDSDEGEDLKEELKAEIPFPQKKQKDRRTTILPLIKRFAGSRGEAKSFEQIWNYVRKTWMENESKDETRARKGCYNWVITTKNIARVDRPRQRPLYYFCPNDTAEEIKRVVISTQVESIASNP